MVNGASRCAGRATSPPLASLPFTSRRTVGGGNKRTIAVATSSTPMPGRAAQASTGKKRLPRTAWAIPSTSCASEGSRPSRYASSRASSVSATASTSRVRSRFASGMSDSGISSSRKPPNLPLPFAV